MLYQAIAGDGIIVQQNEERNCPSDVNKAVQPIYASHESWTGHEKLLYRDLPEDVPLLFDFDDLKGMLPSNVYSAFHNCDSRKCSSELVHLHPVSNRVSKDDMMQTQYINAQYHASTKKGNLCKSLLSMRFRKTAVFGVFTVVRQPNATKSRSRHLFSCDSSRDGDRDRLAGVKRALSTLKPSSS